MLLDDYLNALTRIILLITIAAFFVFRQSLHIINMGILSISFIVIFYIMKQQQVKESIGTVDNIEGFDVKDKKDPFNESISKQEVKVDDKPIFTPGTKKNPLSNVLLTDMAVNPLRGSAPPVTIEVETIRNNIKKAVQGLNPELNTNKMLFGDVYDNIVFDQSNRAFYSMPNTRVENDQSAFAQYLYSDTKYTGKEDTVEGGLSRLKTNARYNFY